MDLHGFENRKRGNVLCLCENTRVSVLLVLFHESLAVWPGQDTQSLWPQSFASQARLEVPRLLLRNEGRSWILAAIFYSGSLSFWLLQNLDPFPPWELEKLDAAPSSSRQVWMVEILRKIGIQVR